MKKNFITLVLVYMALIHSVKAQQTEDLTLQGAKGKLAATLQMPKIEKGKAGIYCKSYSISSKYLSK